METNRLVIFVSHSVAYNGIQVCSKLSITFQFVTSCVLFWQNIFFTALAELICADPALGLAQEYLPTNCAAHQLVR